VWKRIVFLNCTSDRGVSVMHGHRYMAQGMLFDSCTVNTQAGYQTERRALGNVETRARSAIPMGGETSTVCCGT